MKTRGQDVAAWCVLLLIAGIITLFFLWPLARVAAGGFWVNGHFTTRYLMEVFRHPFYAEGLLNSLGLAGGATLLAMILAVPLAVLAWRYEFRGKGVLTGLLLAPMIMPPFVGAIGLQQMLGPFGAINTWLGCGPVDWMARGRADGVMLLQALAFYPVVFLNVSAALGNIDPAMDESAATLGGSAWQRFCRIVLPLMAPGLFAGGSIVFIVCFTDVGTPLMMGYTSCAAVQIFDALKDIGTSPFPYALTFVVMCVSIGLYVPAKALWGRARRSWQDMASAARAPRMISGKRAIGLWVRFGVVLTLALLPHAGLLLMSLARPGSWYQSVFPGGFTWAHYVEALSREVVVRGIRNSLVFSLAAVGVDLVLGWASAVVIVRSRLAWRHVLDALVMLPLAAPGLVVAFGYLAFSSQWSHSVWAQAHPWVAHFLDVRVNPSFFLIVAYALRRLPYMTRAAVAGLQQASGVLENAASSLGAGPMRVAWRITFPMVSGHLVAGAMLAFAFSMLEVSDSLLLAQQANYYPLTKTIYELVRLLGDGRHLAAALGVWAMFFLAAVLFGAGSVLGRRWNAIFRV